MGGVGDIGGESRGWTVCAGQASLRHNAIQHQYRLRAQWARGVVLEGVSREWYVSSYYTLPMVWEGTKMRTDSFIVAFIAGIVGAMIAEWVWGRKHE